MIAEGMALAISASHFIGVPFRFNGRHPEAGLDCIGLLEAALAGIGVKVRLPVGYRLRNHSIEDLIPDLKPLGLSCASGEILPGDVVITSPGPAHHHLLISSADGGFVHAHAGLKRVVESPPPLSWPIVHHWRLITK